MVIDSTESNGDVIIVVIMTASIARLVVRRIGNRMTGLSWLMLSNPEKASQAPAKPISRL
jgi:hypothetical protein